MPPFSQLAPGPVSALHLNREDVAQRCRARVRAGADAADAILAEVFDGARTDSALASEFWGWALEELSRRGVRAPDVLRGRLDGEDLVQSILADLSADAAELSFETRAQFLSLLTRRLAWKRRDRLRGAVSGRRREDLRSDSPPEELPVRSRARTPLTLVASREEAARVAVCIATLAPRDRELVRLRLRGASTDEVASQLGLSIDSARRALSRALQRIRERLNSQGSER